MKLAVCGPALQSFRRWLELGDVRGHCSAYCYHTHSGTFGRPTSMLELTRQSLERLATLNHPNLAPLLTLARLVK